MYHQALKKGFIQRKQRKLDPFVGNVLSVLFIVLGTYALLKFGYVAVAERARGIDVSSVDIGGFETSSYPLVIAGSAIQGALIQTAMHGFKGWRGLLFLGVLALTSVNLSRTSFLIPCILAFLIYQIRRGDRSLPLRWLPLLLFLGVAWLVFKPLSLSVERGEDLATASRNVSDYIEQSVQGGSTIDTQFFDMQATYMAAADEAGKRFYGGTLAPLLFLPIPRFLWPDKPRLNDAALQITSGSRQIVQVGMVPTLAGDSYLNFGWLGCFLIPFVYMFLMHRMFLRISGHGIASSEQLIYLILFAAMLQVFRDGLGALVLYPLVIYLPLTAWSLLSRLMPVAPNRPRRAPAYGGPKYAGARS